MSKSQPLLPTWVPPPGSPPGWTCRGWSSLLGTIVNKARALWSTVTHALPLKGSDIKVSLLSLTLYREASRV